jgi:hypothetical protein
MAIVVGSNNSLSTAANTKTADLITGRNQYVGKGRLQLFAKGSATGMNITLNCGGVALMDDNAIPFFGAAGSLDVNAHGIVDQVVAGGRVELFLRNTTGGALTTDYLVLFTPM